MNSRKLTALILFALVPFLCLADTVVFDGTVKEGSMAAPQSASTTITAGGALAITLPPSSWAGYTFGFPAADITALREKGVLEFWIKGETGKEKDIMVSLLDAADARKPFKSELPLFYYGAVAKKWKKISIPLKDFEDAGYYWDSKKNDRVDGPMNWAAVGGAGFDVLPSSITPVKFQVKNIRIKKTGRATLQAGLFKEYKKYDYKKPFVKPPAAPTKDFKWPGKYRAAVTLTFDDGLDTQIYKAFPLLEKYGLKGSFFITGYSWYRPQNLAVWKKIAQAGHEIGLHSVYHPCDKKVGYMSVGYRLQDYTIERLAAELDGQKNALKEEELLIGKRVNFAYPCGQQFVGNQGKSYVPLIEGMFSAARGIDEVIADPATVYLYDVPAYDGAGEKGKQMIKIIKEAQKNGGWAVFYLHGIGGDLIPLDLKTYEEVLRYLKNNEATIWTATFDEAAEYIKNNR